MLYSTPSGLADDFPFVTTMLYTNPTKIRVNGTWALNNLITTTTTMKEIMDNRVSQRVTKQ